ncbi:hypothetical protein D3C71_1615890 [compost metagenome]
MLGVRHLDRRQVLEVFQLDQRNIGTRILADHLGVKFATVAQLNLDFVGVIHHVVVGDDVALGRVNHYPGAQRLEFLLRALIRPPRFSASAALTHRRALEWRTVLAER